MTQDNFIAYSQIDDRLDDLIYLADETGVSLDLLVRDVGRIDQNTFRALVGNPSSLPRYIASKVSP